MKQNQNRQRRICVHYQKGVCNVAVDIKDFYVHGKIVGKPLLCMYFNVEDK